MSVAKVFRRVWNALAFATVTQVDDSGAVMMLQITIGGIQVCTLPAPQHFGFSSVPPLGSSASAHFLGGDRSNGIAGATNHQPSRPTGKRPGESQQHDAFGKSIYLTENDGIVVNANGSPVTINNSTTVTINASAAVVMNTPLLKVSGDIQDNFGSNARTMAAMRSVYNAHDHAGVQTGSGSTAAPNDTM